MAWKLGRLAAVGISGRRRFLLAAALFVTAAGLGAQVSEVALIPFWGDDDGIIADFGASLYWGLVAKPGFSPRQVDMVNLPDDVPPGGFPPFVSPPPSLTLASPFAMTGDITVNPLSGQWHLRLYLWQTADNRMLFSDEMAAFDRSSLDVVMPGMLDWIFSWVGSVPEPVTVYVEVPVPVPADPVYLEGGMQRPAPNRLFFGFRAGVASQMLVPLFTDEGVEAESPSNFTGALSLNYRFLTFEDFQLGVQAEGVVMYDHRHDILTLTVPLALRATFLFGTSSFSLLGGAYVLIPLMDGHPGFSQPDGFLFGHESDGTLLWGVTAGAGLGFRLGPGSLLAEFRWAMDMFSVQRLDYFHRHTVGVFVGYEWGLMRVGEPRPALFGGRNR